MNENDLLGHPLPGSPVPSNSVYGERVHPQTGIRTFHNGEDFAVAQGTAIAAVADSRIVFTGTQEYRRDNGTVGGAGNYLIAEVLDDRGQGTGLYYSAFHASQIDVEVGQTVERGETIARVGSTGGSTGPHLHFEVFEGGDRARIEQGLIGSSGARRFDPNTMIGESYAERLTLREGDQNDAVAALQRELIGRGLLPEGADDGDFGRDTRTAVEALQTQLGVGVDGIVGNGTRTAIEATRTQTPPEETPSEPPAPEAPTPDVPTQEPPAQPGPTSQAIDTEGPFAAVSTGALYGTSDGTPLGALDGEQSYALARALFGDGAGAAALQAFDQHYGAGDGTLVQREIALANHEGQLNVGRENADPASGYNIGTFQVGGARSTPDVSRERYNGLVDDGVARYEAISGATVDRATLSAADLDVFAHLGHIAEKGAISRTSTVDSHFSRLADPSLQGDALARFMSDEIQVGVPAIGISVVAQTDPATGTRVDLDAVEARAQEPDATRSEPSLPVLSSRVAADYAPAVEEWQNTLLAAGYDLGPAGADGNFGRATAEATRQAQRDAGLPDDGVVGGDTWGAYAEARGQVIDGPRTPETPTPPETPDPTTPDAPPQPGRETAPQTADRTQTLDPNPTAADPGSYISSSFGVRGGRNHYGTDIAAFGGTPTTAIADGEVIFAGANGGAGTMYIVRHGDATTGYSYSSGFHLQDGSLAVEVGDTVEKGDVLGRVGNTGASRGDHLHLEYFEGGDEAVIRQGGIGASGARRLDPEQYLGQTFTDRITIREGDRNEAVAELQRELIHRGLLPEGADDGDFGRDTRTAVEALQADLGLDVDGIVGNETRTAIEQSRTQAPTEQPTETPTPPNAETPAREPLGAAAPEEYSVRQFDQSLAVGAWDGTAARVLPSGDDARWVADTEAPGQPGVQVTFGGLTDPANAALVAEPGSRVADVLASAGDDVAFRTSVQNGSPGSYAQIPLGAILQHYDSVDAFMADARTQLAVQDGAPPSITAEPPSMTIGEMDAHVQISRDPGTAQLLRDFDARALQMLSGVMEDPQAALSALNQAAVERGPLTAAEVTSVLRDVAPEARTENADTVVLGHAVNARATIAEAAPETAAAVDAVREADGGSEIARDPATEPTLSRTQGDGATQSTGAPVVVTPVETRQPETAPTY